MEDTKYLETLPLYRESYIQIQKLSNNQYKLLKFLFIMTKIFNAMHQTCAWTATLTVFFFIDLPIKACLYVIFLLFGLIISIFYPIVKNIKFPEWMFVLYNYTTNIKNNIASKVLKCWQTK